MKKKLLIPLILIFLVTMGVGFKKLYDDKQVKISLSSAQKYYSVGDYYNAILEYEKVITIDKKNTQGYMGLINTFMLQENDLSAKETIEKAINIKPKDPKLLIANGFYLLKDDKNTDAINFYKKALSIDPNNEQALSGLYYAYMANGDSDAAKELIDNAIKNPKNINSFVINALCETKDWYTAMNLLTEAYKKDNENVAIFDALSTFKNFSDEFTIKLKEQIENNNDTTMYKLFYLTLCSKENLVDNGLEIAKDIETTMKDNIQYKINLAKLYRLKGNVEDCNEIFSQLEKSNGDNFLVLHDIAWNYYDNKDYDKALEYAKKSLAYNPEYEDNYAYLIPSALSKLEKYSEAIPYLTKALSLNSSETQTMINISDTYSELNDKENALKFIKKAELLGSENVKTLNQLAEFYYNKEDYKRALDLYKKSYALDNKNYNALLKSSICYDKLGAKTQALEAADKLISDNPDNVRYKFLKGSILALGNRYNESLSIYTGIQSSYGDKFQFINNMALVKYNLNIITRDTVKSELSNAIAIAKNNNSEETIIKDILRNIDALEPNVLDKTLWYWY